MRHHVKKTVWLAGFFSLFIGAQSHATISTPVRVCSLPLPPQTMPDGNGNPDGYAVKVLQAVARQMNWDLKITYFPWIRVLAHARSGECDVVLTVLKRDDYESYLVFPKKPILNQKNVIVALSSANIRYNGNIESFMRQHTIGLCRDKAIDADFERIRTAPWANVDYANNPTQNMMKLLAKRFDAAIENDLTIIYEMKKLGRLNEVEILEPAINVTPAYITFPRAGNLKDSANQFDKALGKFEKTAEFRKLKTFYFGDAN
jgi:polar amino acid transport system substrate-binding protein